MEKFKCLLVDPPWRFGNQATRVAPAKAGHYETMPMDDIIGLGPWIREKVDPTGTHLWLCAPNGFVLSGDAVNVAKLWGFKPKQILTWVKPSFGFGNWMRNSTEHILLCVMGRLPPLVKNKPTHIHGKRTRHSEKPQELYEHIESVSPGPRLEMFARGMRSGWKSWGVEAPEETRIK
jgi:N6-adenosine-specific RNA methylase IME4